MATVNQDPVQHEMNMAYLERLRRMLHGEEGLPPPRELGERSHPGNIAVPTPILLIPPQKGAIIPVSQMLGGNGNGAGNKSVVESLIKKAQEERDMAHIAYDFSCPEPECRGRIVTKRGPYGEFLGCSEFAKGCRWTAALPTPNQFINIDEARKLQQNLFKILEEGSLACPGCGKALSVGIKKKGGPNSFYLKCKHCGSFHRSVTKLGRVPRPGEKASSGIITPEAPHAIWKPSKAKFLGLCPVCKSPLRRRKGTRHLECIDPRCKLSYTPLERELEGIQKSCPSCGGEVVSERLYIQEKQEYIVTFHCKRFDVHKADDPCRNSVWWFPGNMPGEDRYSHGGTPQEVAFFCKYLTDLG